MALIEARTLKGFRDYLPETMMPRERLMETARRVYRSYGFAPIDTPALEYEEILTGKGGEESDKQLYRFEDHGGRKVALRFDLTVPLARFVAQYHNELGLPFKRYHIGPVWRGENTQRGRYREFVQCDFDTIGVETITADIESVLVVHDLFRALGFEKFQIRVNNRKLLNGLLESLDLAERSAAILRVLDKLPKAGEAKVREELTGALALDSARADEVIRIASIQGSNAAILAELKPLARGEKGEQGLAELSELLRCVEAAGVPAERVQLDPSIARGLDYYTGTILETFLGDLPAIGSVCSGGRYDNLTQLYTKERMPGIGASLGLDRLLAAMEELGMLEKRRTPVGVMLAFFDAQHLSDYLRLAARLREAGIGVEFYPEPKKLGAQLKYADRRGFRHALILGSDEWKNGRCQLKDLASGTSRELALEDGRGALSPELLAALSA
ncbi:MAG: histidine--tRNA ligase [Planctomycetes bacterium]|nr:histidine--tRNA ligase [Planctomycetota bacterium]